jgi:hypothetical protein
MVEQLGLFPECKTTEAALLPWQAEAGGLDEAFAACPHLRERRQVMALFAAIGRFAQYSPLNGCLLFLQSPSATRVATAAHWRRRHGRSIKPGARPLAILAPMSPVKFVFDIADTQGPDKPPEAPGTPRSSLSQILLRTVDHCAQLAIAVKQTPLPGANAGFAAPLTVHNRHHHEGLDPRSAYLVVLNADQSSESRFSALAGHLGQIFCGHHGIDTDAWWSDRRTISRRQAELEAAATAELVCRRRGLESAAGKVFAAAPEPVLPVFSLTAVFQAVAAIEQMGRANRKRPGGTGQ